MAITFNKASSELFKHIRKTALHQNTQLGNEKSQFRYLRKHVRFSDYYNALDETEQKEYEKQIGIIIHEFVTEENKKSFSIYDLHFWLLKMNYGR